MNEDIRDRVAEGAKAPSRDGFVKRHGGSLIALLALAILVLLLALNMHS